MKAQSEVLGYIIIFASFTAFISIIALSTYGVSSQQNEILQNERNLKNFQSLSNSINSISYGNGDKAVLKYNLRRKNFLFEEKLNLTVKKNNKILSQKKLGYLYRKTNYGRIYYISTGTFLTSEGSLITTSLDSNFGRKNKTVYYPIVSIKTKNSNSISGKISLEEIKANTQIINIDSSDKVEIIIKGQKRRLFATHLTKKYKDEGISTSIDNSRIKIELENSAESPLDNFIIKENTIEISSR